MKLLFDKINTLAPNRDEIFIFNALFGRTLRTKADDLEQLIGTLRVGRLALGTLMHPESSPPTDWLEKFLSKNPRWRPTFMPGMNLGLEMKRENRAQELVAKCTTLRAFVTRLIDALKSEDPDEELQAIADSLDAEKRAKQSHTGAGEAPAGLFAVPLPRATTAAADEVVHSPPRFT